MRCERSPDSQRTGRPAEPESMKARPWTIVMVLIIVAIVAGLGYLVWPALS
jgi:uncharacterized membrane protein HdeD (DUF308 family)